MMASAALEDLAARLSPAQQHVVLRGSDAEVWGYRGSVGYSYPRHWYDLVYGRKWAQHRTLVALQRLGIYERDESLQSFWRLTSLGLSVQLVLRQQRARAA